MITEGRLDHIESIVSQIEKYEKWEPKWDVNKNIMSACGAITLFGMGLIIEGLCYEEITPKFFPWVIGITIGALIGAILCFLMINRHHQENKECYSDGTKVIKDILLKVRNSTETSIK